MDVLKAWRQQRTDKRVRRDRIKQLRDEVDLAFEQTLGTLKSSDSAEDYDLQRDVYDSMTTGIWNELKDLEQHDLRLALYKAGIKIPESAFLYRAPWEQHAVMDELSVNDLKHQLRKYRDARIEFWAKLVLPIVSILISFAALLKRR